MEGLYLRTEANGTVTGRAKFVRIDFVEKVKQSEHWQHRTLVPNLLTKGADIWKMKTWSAMKYATDAEILAWAESAAWARHMAACSGYPQWHAEGEVWTHTRMVCAELEQAKEWPLLDRCSQLKLLFTGLLHVRRQAGNHRARSRNRSDPFSQTLPGGRGACQTGFARSGL